MSPTGDSATIWEHQFSVSVHPIGYFMYQPWVYPALMSMGQQPRRHSALNDALAEEIRAQRRAIEMSQAELGKRAGISRGQVIRIENLERIIDVSQADALARALGLSMVELMQRAEVRVAAAQGDPGVQSEVSGE